MDPSPVGLYALRLFGRTQLSSAARAGASGFPRPRTIAKDRTTSRIVRRSALVASLPRSSIAGTDPNGAEAELRCATGGRARHCLQSSARHRPLALVSTRLTQLH